MIQAQRIDTRPLKNRKIAPHRIQRREGSRQWRTHGRERRTTAGKSPAPSEGGGLCASGRDSRGSSCREEVLRKKLETRIRRRQKQGARIRVKEFGLFGCDLKGADSGHTQRRQSEIIGADARKPCLMAARA